MAMCQLMIDEYRRDPWIAAIMQQADAEMLRFRSAIAGLRSNLFFDRMDADQAAIEEMICDMHSDADLDTRRSKIEARWKISSMGSSLQLLQAICDSWHYGSYTVSFEDGIIIIEYTDKRLVPDNLPALWKALREASPAHLPLVVRRQKLKDD